MGSPDWLGVRGKTLWDWLQLLIVPAILIGVTFVWGYSQTRSDNKREDRRTAADNKREDRRITADRVAAEKAHQDATLQAYFTQMSGLMLDKKLLTSKEGDAVRAVARTVTLAALRRLNGERKGEAVLFLTEARLLDAKSRRVNLNGADLMGANLTDSYLEGVDLEGTDLTDANLRDAILRDANLGDVYLGDADLEGANLEGANLEGANLEGANLEGVMLTDAQRKQATNVPP
jgi:hypothetical protein